MANTEDLTELRRSVDGLTGELKKSNNRLDTSEKSNRGLRRRNRWLTGIVVLLACGTGGSIYAAVSANGASNDAKAASTRVASVAHATYESCLANNGTRDDTRNLWAAVIATLQPLTTSSQGRQFIADIEHDVDLATTPRVCRSA